MPKKIESEKYYANFSSSLHNNNWIVNPLSSLHSQINKILKEATTVPTIYYNYFYFYNSKTRRKKNKQKRHTNEEENKKKTCSAAPSWVGFCGRRHHSRQTNGPTQQLCIHIYKTVEERETSKLKKIYFFFNLRKGKFSLLKRSKLGANKVGADQP